jgi:hypothetical protein
VLYILFHIQWRVLATSHLPCGREEHQLNWPIVRLPGIHADDGLIHGLKRHDFIMEFIKLDIPIRIIPAFIRLFIGL